MEVSVEKTCINFILVQCGTMYISRGAEAGGILGVNTPHFFGLTTPTFWRDLKMGAGEKFRR